MKRLLLPLCLLVHLVLGVFWLTATPLQTIELPDNVPAGVPAALNVGLGPDEKEHYIYLRSLAEGKGIPSPDPQHRKRPEQWVSYQAQHPPLFYALAALLYKAGAGWTALRALCLLCGLATVFFGAKAAEAAFPDRPLVALGAAPALALLPMLGHMNGCLSNEPLAMALTAAAWWRAVVLARRGGDVSVKDAALVGLLLGLAALARLTALIWAPAVLWVLWTRRGNGLVPLLVCAVAIALPLLPWLAGNVVLYGAPVLRTFHRPLLSEGKTLADFLGPGIAPPGFGVLTPAACLLWFAGCAWTPTWVIQFYLPGGVAPLSGLLLVVEIVLAVVLANHASRSRRGLEGDPDPVGRAILRGAGIALALCLAGQVQQMLFSDWDVVLSTGRYTVAAAAGSSLLLVFALSTITPRSRQAIAALVLAVVMLAFDLYSVGLVRQFYRDKPTQDAVQPITGSGP